MALDRRDPHLHRLLHARARILDAVRRFFRDRGYLEVETPVRIPTLIPEAHIDPITSAGAFLHPSPEICMKRLLAWGHPRIFQICKCFRRDEAGERHLTEFTMLEWYQAGASYLDLMAQCEELVALAAAAAGLTDAICYQDGAAGLTPPWTRLSVSEAFARYAPVSAEEALATDRFDEIMGCEIEPRLGFGRPLFLYDYPLACGSLARRRPGAPVAERFELYICGMELCNGFSELTDAREQRARFETENAVRRQAGRPACAMPERFLTDLAHMPPAAGNALGIDRLVMVLTDTPEITNVVAFGPEHL